MGKRKKTCMVKEVISKCAQIDNDIISILTLNIMSMKYSDIECDHNERYNSQLTFLLEEDTNLIFLQEVDEIYFEKLIAHEISNKYFIYKTNLDPYGLIILSKWQLNMRIFSFGLNSHKKVLILQNDKYQFVNIHLSARKSEAKQRASQL